jgi:hypothetical protein
MKRMVKPHSVVNDDFVKYYHKEKEKFSKLYRIKTDAALIKNIARSICKEVRDEITESEGGVVMKNWGYFYVQRSHTKVMHYKQKWDKSELKLSLKSNGFKYNILFLPKLEGVKNFWGWSFDYTFTDVTIMSLYKKIDKGYRYKSFPWTVLRLKLI